MITKDQLTKTRLYSFDPLQPHFYIIKLWFTWVCISFLISAQKHRLWVLVRTALLRSSNKFPQLEQKHENYQNFTPEFFHFFFFFVVKFSIYLNRRVFVMRKYICMFCSFSHKDRPVYFEENK